MQISKIATYILSLSSLISISTTKINAQTKTASKVVYADTNSLVNRQIIDSLNKYYANEVRKGFNGSVLVGNKGKIIYKRHFGYANKSTGEMLSDKTSTQLSSTSKPFTAIAIMWLNQNKYLDINLPVNAYLKNFPYNNITVKMLLNHRSGLPNYTSTNLPRWTNQGPMYNLDIQNYLATSKPKLNFTPDTKFAYCNTNYALLGRIIEEVSGTPYKDFLNELIFEPLGMNNTFVFDPLDDMSNRKISISYNANWTIFANNHQDGVYGDKGIYSTPEDMYLWDQSFYSNKILNNNTYKRCISGCSPSTKNIKDYGLGWRMYDFKNGQKLVFHNGRWHGNNSVFYRFIDENTTVIVLGNRFNSKIYEQGKAVYKILRNISPKMFTYTFDGETDVEE